MHAVQNIFLVLVYALCMSACATMEQPPSAPVSKSQIDQLSTDINIAQLDELLAHNKPKYIFQQSYHTSDYQVSVYDYMVGMDSELEINCQIIRLCAVIDVEKPILTDYVLIQKLPDLTLVEWGTLEHLNKHKDATIHTLITDVTKRIANDSNVL